MEQKLMDGWEFTLGEPKEADFRPVELPHDWAVHAPINREMEQGEPQGFLDRWGIGWYRRTLTLPEIMPDHVYLLQFDGIYENSVVWVNEREAGGRKYGYSRFTLDITDYLKEGDNSLLVKVDNSTGPADRWYSGAGIYRTVKLLTLHRWHIDPEELRINTLLTPAGGAEADIMLGRQAWGRRTDPETLPENAAGDMGSEQARLQESGSEERPAAFKVTARLLEPTGVTARGPGNSCPDVFFCPGSSFPKALPCPGKSCTEARLGFGTSYTEASRAEIICGGAACGQEGCASAGAAEDGQNLKICMKVEEARLWSPEEPNLYLLELTLSGDGQVYDVYRMRVGFREIRMEPEKGMFLNGKSIKIKGFCIHQEAGCLGTAVPPEIWRERLLRFREIGCNAVRAAHHIHSAEFLDLCDELGFLVYEEAFDKWTGGSYGRYFDTEWRRDLECMVRRDRSHACIFMWGVGNEAENQGQESMLRILEMLRDCVKSLDDTRPVSYAMNPHFKFESDIDISAIKDIQRFVDAVDDREIWDLDERVRRIRKIAELVDVICCNYQEQWYPAIHAAAPDKLILGTEIYQYFKGDEQQMQNFTEEVPWLDCEKYDYCIGGMVWTGIDYLGESMGFPAKGWAGALIRTNNERKPLSYLYEGYWTKSPMVYLAVMDQTLRDDMVREQWDAPQYAAHWSFPSTGRRVIPYMIATNCEEVLLMLNGKRFYIRRPEEFPNRMITGYLPYQPGEIVAKGLNAGKEVCSYTLRTAGPAAALRFEREKASAPAEPGYTMLFTVKAVDREGTPVLHESAPVTFRVSGPARLAGVDNGDLCSGESYAGPSMHLYRGCVSALIRLTGKPGRVELSASAETLGETRLILHIS